MLPNFLVIGAEKSGSTYILKCLRSHPAIFMPYSEVPFFEDGFFDQGIDEFEKHFADAKSNQIVGVKRPTWLGHPECVDRIQSLIPNAKLISILRNPLDRFVSAYFHFMSFGFIPVAPMEKGITNLLTGKYDHLPRAHELLLFGKYGEHLERYRKQFAEHQMKEVLLEDVKENSIGVLKELFNFLDVDSNYVPKEIKSQPMTAVYSLPRLRFRNFFATFYRTRSQGDKYITHHRNPIYYLTMGIDKLVGRIRPAKKPKLSAKAKNSLLEYYLEDIEKLEGILERDLSLWKQA